MVGIEIQINKTTFVLNNLRKMGAQPECYFGLVKPSNNIIKPEIHEDNNKLKKDSRKAYDERMSCIRW